MATDDERSKVLEALVSNGLDFIERSAQELADQKKFSVAHFATGLELVLKARLFAEHWSLIGASPHGCAWSSVRDGTVRSIQASDICAAITSVTGTPLQHESPVFARIFHHRNKVLHWIPHDNIHAVAAEQCLAWYHLHALLRGRWKELFAASGARVDQVDTALRANRVYLEVRFRELKPVLGGHEGAGRLTECSACRFRSAVLDNPRHHVDTFLCAVCLNRDSVARVHCGRWIPIDELPCECECGDDHDRDELLEELDPTTLLSPKESLSYESNRLYCGECLDLDKTVAPDGDSYVCVGCGIRHDPTQLDSCEWCSEPWAGYDTEHSYYFGCEFCDGFGPK